MPDLPQPQPSEKRPNDLEAIRRQLGWELIEQARREEMQRGERPAMSDTGFTGFRPG